VGYEVRIAGDADLEAVFRLRYDVFYREMGASDSVSMAANLDVDQYDKYCDHLVVVAGNDVVGTYRILPVGRLEGTGLTPYCDGEFDLRPIQQRYGTRILELGRSCVHPDHRNGPVPRMLWRAIFEYARRECASALIGCVSIHGADDWQALLMRKFLRSSGHWHPEFDLQSKLPALAKGGGSPSAGSVIADSGEYRSEIPPLMRGYMNIGAKICGGPALDVPFATTDFLMLLDLAEVPARTLRMFAVLAERHASSCR
jgi:putative hemolysin